MKYLLLTFVLVSSLLFSQNKRFIYDYKFVSDSTQKDKVTSEQMYLDIAAKGSKYYSRNVFVSDSMTTAYINKNIKAGNYNIDFTGIKRTGRINSVVEKYYPEYRVSFFVQSDGDEYNVEDDRKMNWKITGEKEKIGDWEVQKATLELYGRKWTAWFSPDIPFPDDPYKFHGLPGLIVKISDETNSHIMEL